MNARFGGLSSAAMVAVLTACMAPTEAEPSDIGASEEELRVVPGRRAIGIDTVRSENMVHGIAADENLVFVTEPLNGRVVAYSRLTGCEIAELPAPEGGFLLPFTIRAPHPGRLVILDSGGFPSPTIPAIPRVYDYSYRWNWRTHSLEATLTRTVRFDGLPVVFGEDLEVLADGTYVMADSVLGSLWLIAPDGTIRPGMVASSFAPGEGLPFMQPCVVGPTTVEGIPFDLGGGFAPGLSSIAADGEYVYWGAYCYGGIHRLSLDTLRDSSRTAEERAEEIEVVSARAEGTLEVLHGLTFNQYNRRDTRLYATDPFNMQVIRIDVETGEREVLLRDPALLNFPVASFFAPPILGVQSLFVASDQEHRFAALNQGIEEDMFNPPFIAAQILFRR
jgi:hypothetical protein